MKKRENGWRGICFVYIFSCLVWASPNRQSAYQGRICLNNFTRCHSDSEVADQTCPLTGSHNTDTGPAVGKHSPHNYCHASGSVAIRIPTCNSLVWFGLRANPPPPLHPLPLFLRPPLPPSSPLFIALKAD